MASHLHPAPGSAWVTDSRGATRQWLQQHDQVAYAEHSIAQYAAMTGTAADWLQSHRNQSLLTAHPVDLDAFLNQMQGRGGKPASAATLKRYRSTLSMVFQHLVQQGLRASDPIADLRGQAARLPNIRQAPRFLSAAQSEAYMTWVLAQPRAHWCDLRDAALRLIYLASGITVEESLALKTGHLHSQVQPASLQVQARSPVTRRRIPLPPWSVEVLEAWRLRRLTLPLFDDVLFPARKRSRSNAVDGGEPADQPISTSELYETIRPAMVAAGFEDEQLGPQTLRNTYAVRQMDAGIEFDTLQAWMGLRTRFTLEAIRREIEAGAPGPTPA